MTCYLCDQLLWCGITVSIEFCLDRFKALACFCNKGTCSLYILKANAHFFMISFEHGSRKLAALAAALFGTAAQIIICLIMQFCVMLVNKLFSWYQLFSGFFFFMNIASEALLNLVFFFFVLVFNGEHDWVSVNKPRLWSMMTFKSVWLIHLQPT